VKEFFIDRSDSELSKLIIDNYSDYIDDYADMSKFNLFKLDEVEGKMELNRISVSCLMEAVLLSELDHFIKEVSCDNYIFPYSINKNSTDKNLLLFRFAKVSFENNLPRYSARRKMAIRDKKIDSILQ
jgi:hypothetical protein